jgi:hypothetical protein
MRRRQLLEAWIASTLAAGCGSAPAGDGATPAVASPVQPERPRDAAKIAVDLVGGKVNALVFVDRVRVHPVGPRLISLGPARALLAGTSVDPLRDLERVFVTAPSTSDRRAIMFAEHKLDDARIQQAMMDLVQKSDPPGAVVPGAPYPTVKVQRRGRGGLVSFIPPHFVVALPEEMMASLAAFATTGGLPGPEGVEAARFSALDPSTTLRGRGVPAIPPSISAVQGIATLRGDGGISVDAVGPSASPTQAADDADYLTDAIERATTVTLGFVKIRVIKPIEFVAKDDNVEAHVDMSRAEIEQLLGLAESFAG